jgi:hypothetical protein
VIVFFGTIIVNPFLARSIIQIHQGAPFAATVKENYYDTKHNVVETKVTKELLHSSIWSAIPFSDLEITNWEVNRKVKGIDYNAYFTYLTNPYSNIFMVLFIMSIPFLWVITWFRLKEREL